MKLRVKAAVGGGGGSLRVEVPPNGTLSDLRNALSQALGVSADSVRVSLNKRDEIHGDAAVSLLDAGIRPGDLIFYLGNNGLPGQSARTDDANRAAGLQARPNTELEDMKRRRTLCAAAADERIHHQQQESIGKVEEDLDKQQQQESLLVKETQKVEGPLDKQQQQQQPELSTSHEQQPMEVDTVVDPEKFRSHIPNLLSRLLAQSGGTVREPPMFLVVALHGVMLETGFVMVGSKEPWESPAMTVVLKYTLPELVQNGSSVILRCQTLGNGIVVYGVVAGCSQVYRLDLSAPKFLMGAVRGLVGTNALAVFKDAFALWKEAKDKLTLPLLTLICERAGLPLPTNFQLLPTDIKVRILGFLPAPALATVACVCSELRFLSSDEALWKQRYLDAFDINPGEYILNWKMAFASEWRRRRRRGRNVRDFLHARRPFPYNILPAPRRPLPCFIGDHLISGPFSDLPGSGSLQPLGGEGSLFAPGGGLLPSVPGRRGLFPPGGGRGPRPGPPFLHLNQGPASSSITSDFMLGRLDDFNGDEEDLSTAHM